MVRGLEWSDARFELVLREMGVEVKRSKTFMSNGERQTEVEGYKHLVAPYYRVILFFSTKLSLRVRGWTNCMIDPGLKDVTKGYSHKGVEGVCDSVKERK